jgi:hypothetical protein
MVGGGGYGVSLKTKINPLRFSLGAYLPLASAFPQPCYTPPAV